VLNPASPVINNLLKASTSIEARPGLVTVVAGITGPPRSVCSIVSNVFEKGFAGALVTPSTASSSDDSDVMFSKGSPSSRNIAVGGLLAAARKASSPIVEAESGMEGDGGGGDCTRTFFVTFLGASTASTTVDRGGGSGW
jgi:hypothetical protein